jgi:O-antigen ligase
MKDSHFRYGIVYRDINPLFKMLPLFLGMILLGSSLALFADSPLLVLPFLGAMVLTSFAALDYTLYILVAFLPFSFRFIFAYGTEMQVPTEPLLAIMAVALMLRLIVMGSKGVRIKYPFRYPVMLYALSLCLSLFNSPRLYSSTKGIIRAIAYMTLSIVVFNIITDRRKLKWLFIAAVVPAAVAVGWTVVFLADRLDMWRWTSAYEGLPFTSYVHYGAFVATIFLFILGRFIFDRSNYDRVIWTFMLIFYGIAICFSFSRGVWLSIIAAVGFMLMQRAGGGTKHRKFVIVAVSVFLLVILLSLPLASKIITSRISTFTNLSYASNRERLLRWGTAILMFLRHPIIGNGYGSFAFTYVNDPAIVGAYVSKFKMGAHSEYIQALAETGIIGFAAWMWIICSFYIYGFRLLKKLDANRVDSFKLVNEGDRSFWRAIVIGVMAAELSLVLHFIVNNLIQADIIGVPFWLLIGILPAIGNIIERESQGSTNHGEDNL